MIRKILTAIVFLFLTQLAQSQKRSTMADEMRSNGKIYVVVAVMLTIFMGIIIYLIRLDRKITKLEKQF
jgi:hypothetical protein